MSKLGEIYKLCINFLMIIVLFPLGVDLFEHVGRILLGAQLVTLHPWLVTVLAYFPVMLLLLIYLKATLEPFEKYGLTWSNKMIVPSLIIGLVSAVIIFLMDGMDLSSFGVPPTPSLVVAVGFIVSWGVLAPFVEELLFRGVIQSTFMEVIKSNWKVHPAVFIGAGFEVLWHLITPFYFTASGQYWVTFVNALPQLVYVAIFGAIGGYIYSKTKSIAGPFIIHGLGNAGELLLYWFL